MRDPTYYLCELAHARLVRLGMSLLCEAPNPVPCSVVCDTQGANPIGTIALE